MLIKNYGPKQYIIFKGHPGTRKIFRGTRYLTNNPKVVRLAIGPKGILKAVKGGFVITIVLSVGIEVFNYFIRDNSSLSNLLGTVSSDLIKFGISAIAAAVTGLAIGSATVIGTAAAVPIIAAVAVGLITGYLLNKIDAKLGATAALIKAYENLGIKLNTIKYEANRMYNYLDNNPGAIMRLFGGPVYYGGYGY